MTRALRRSAVAIAGMALAAGCMHAGGQPPPTGTPAAPQPDSATIGLWRFDEPAGRVAADSGPAHLDAAVGTDTRVEFGRYGSARKFVQSIESFAGTSYAPVLEAPHAISVEAWVSPSAFGRFEDTPIACRWTERANERSWMFSIIGRNFDIPGLVPRSPHLHTALTQDATAGRLMFAFQPAGAAAPQSFFSTKAIVLGRWTHVAATFDGQVVRFFIDDRLDSQHAYAGEIRASEAPLMIGNYFDPRWLTDFGGELRVSNTVDREPYYAYEGVLDELRISGQARSDFWSAPGK
jgi:hypothetical protein